MSPNQNQRERRQRTPSSPLARGYLDAKRRLDVMQTQPQRAKGQPLLPIPLDSTERRIYSALIRYESGSSRPDGFPGGGDGGSGSDVKLTPVEAAANARIGVNDQGRPMRRELDPVREHTLRACQEYMRAVEGLENAKSAMDALDRIGDLSDLPEVVGCESCARALAVPRPWEHAGTVGGRLLKKTHLCGLCYSFVEDNGQLPSEAQLVNHEQTGRWKIRVAG